VLYEPHINLTTNSRHFLKRLVFEGRRGVFCEVKVRSGWDEPFGKHRYGSAVLITFNEVNIYSFYASAVVVTPYVW